MRKWYGNPWAMLLTLSLGFFMTMLDLTIVNIAIPSIITDLHTSLDGIGWVINVYVIVLAVLLITAGRLGDLRGPRNLFLIGIAVFTLSSIGGGLAQTPGQLIAARAVQGLGAALLLPQTMAIIIGTFPPSKRGTALGIWGAVAGLATLAGPTVGGLLVTAAGWRWVFFINVPIGVLVIVMGLVVLPNAKPGRMAPLDLPGVLLASVGLVLLTYGLVEGQRYDWGTVRGWISIPLIIGAGALFLALFLVDQARKQDRQPLLLFSLFGDRNFTLMNGANMLVAITMVSTFLPLSIYLQSVLGFSALKAGMSMAPLAVVSMLTAPASGKLVDKIGGKYILAFGMLLFGVGIGYVLLVAQVDSPWYVFLPGLLIGGLGLGCTFGPMQTTATYNVPPQLAGAASGVLNSNRQLGSVLGGLAVVTVLHNQLLSNVDSGAAAKAAALPEQYRAAFVNGMHEAAAADAGTGAGQLGLRLPTGLAPTIADQLTQASQDVFTHAIVAAFRPTMAITVIAMAIGVALCSGVKQVAHLHRQHDRAPGQPGQAGQPAPARPSATS